MKTKIRHERYRAVTEHNVDREAAWQRMPVELQEATRVVSTVLPFRTNSYVIRELIDWDNIPNDPIFQLVFPQRGMLSEGQFAEIEELLKGGSRRDELAQVVHSIRSGLNPHPDGQLTHNIPTLNGRPLQGLQHKYDSTVLFFPSQGQTCHAYCTYCFRWAQFVGMPEVKFEASGTEDLVAYLKANPSVTDVLITGGDPMVMKTHVLRKYIEPLLQTDLGHIQNIRIGTKSLAYWPQRFVTDEDADDCLLLFEEIAKKGKHLAIMGHYSHSCELQTEIARQAVARIQGTGAQIRMQAPLIRHVNDDPRAWVDLWTDGVKLGMIPYYMFVERDTGARGYFEVPLVRCYEIFRESFQMVSGLARTVRGPSMSAFPGKVRVVGVTAIKGVKVFVLELIQARNRNHVGQPFFAQFDPKASWFDDLRPAFGDQQFFFETSSDFVNDLNHIEKRPPGIASGTNGHKINIASF